MGRHVTTYTKPGLTLAQHRQLGEDLRQVRGQLLGLRGQVKEAIGSATSGYGEATKCVLAIERLQTALLLEATGAYADQASLQELRRLYGTGEGA